MLYVEHRLNGGLHVPHFIAKFPSARKRSIPYEIRYACGATRGCIALQWNKDVTTDYHGLR